MHTVFLEKRPVVFQRLPHQFVEFKPLPLQMYLVLRDAGDVEQVVDQMRELTGLPIDNALGPLRLFPAG